MDEELKEYVDELRAEMRGGFRELNGGLEELRGGFRELNGGLEEIRESVGGLQESFSGVRDDLAMIKGAHARNETVRKPARIADGLGYQFVYELPEAALLEFGRQAADKGKDDVESFTGIDLVMMVQNDRYQPHYLAVEASYTVGDDDIRRATRTASYLEELTGIPSVPVVAGVGLMEGLEDRVANGEVRWYQIPKRDLQPR